MISDDLLKLLVCPDNRTRLSRAEPELVTRLNAAVAEGRLKNKAGQAVENQLGGALVREDRTIAYPVIDEIPMLLVDEGIPLSQVGG
jgi:uncharacterized protein YbaR (Trm112 family)